MSTSKTTLSTVLFLVLIASTVTTVKAEEPVEIIRVQEKWSLEVGEPNLNKNAPQVSMTMSPHADIEHEFFVLEVNMHGLPTYSAGGIQVQRWNDDQAVAVRNSPITTSLSTTSEVVSWTQELTVQNGTVTFEVIDGSSTTWGNFGGEGYLKSSAATGQENLNSYRPALSILNSGISYAGNRVVSLTLLRIEWELSDGRKFELQAPIDIDSDLDPWE